MKTHLLIDVDSKIPNLALMKISAWAKAQGDRVDFHGQTAWPDEVWISCIFTWNRSKALGIALLFPDSKIHYGGTGFDWGEPRDHRIELPPEIEAMPPDYEPYGDPRPIGFCQRGCNRKCQFCDVWRKEGRIPDNDYKRILDWVPDGRRDVLLLEHDMALYDDWKHDQILQDCRDSGRNLSITQGYDIRCLDQRRAGILADRKPWDLKFRERRLYIAWDYIGIEGWIRRGIPMLLEAGFKGREIMCYIICGFNTTEAEDLHRFHVLWKEYGVYPFVMRYNNRRDLPRLNHFSRWINRPALFKSVPWEDYIARKMPP